MGVLSKNPPQRKERADLLEDLAIQDRLIGVLAVALRTYAVQPRDSHKTLAFFGNNARDALAEFMGVPVLELEPGSDTLKHHMSETFYKKLKEGF